MGWYYRILSKKIISSINSPKFVAIVPLVFVESNLNLKPDKNSYDDPGFSGREMDISCIYMKERPRETFYLRVPAKLNIGLGSLYN